MTVFRDDDDLDRQIELAGELEVALVVRGHGHHRAGAVVAEDEVRDPDGHRLLRERVDRAEAGIEPLLLDLAADARGAVLQCGTPAPACGTPLDRVILSASVATSGCSGPSSTNVAP